ncbi:hypothetical protein [Pseudochryseolinea flava]|uniref:Uncharacterized protein n=1 Tax=Pseudochryseolinea flava TaxID=2059302 RepID=A0A364Y0W6_9BACT|nr:hypothetical protein [Pseudochryseolinea flava]RAV99577.1 hypothetical protein DQQ10_18430 [Pseudochryseolinea flava]
MELKFWIYLIIGAIYLLSRLLKKKEPEQQDIPNYQPEKPARKFDLPSAKPTATPGKSLTFEELLREISESKTATPVQTTVQTTTRPYQEAVVDYDDNLGEEAQDLEDTGYDYRKKDKIYDVYEEAKRQAFNRPSLEETMKVEDTVVRYGKFKEFEQAPQRDLVKEYLSELSDPEGMKKAVVMSEILQRRF